ncbi:MAG: hypothetical protein HUU10_01660 [Bacteroidetes bacterium]|nr:hypothetical protein [Bacteroidota bacterium]
MNTALYEIFTAYYNQAVQASDRHDFKQSSEAFEKAFEVLSEIRTECLRKYAGRKITRVRTADEIELERLKGLVTDLRNQLGDRFLELDDLETELGLFQTDYNFRVGRLYLQLDKLDYEIRMVRMKIERFHAGKPVDEQSILDELTDLTRQLEADAHQLDEDERTLRAMKQSRRELTEEQKSELRTLYRDLAKIYHPDKARNESELAYFDEVMKAINDAYHQSDLDVLRKIEAKAHLYIEVEQIGESLAGKIDRYRMEEKKLRVLTDSIQSRLKAILESDSHQLMIRVKSYKPDQDAYYQGLADDLNQRIRRKQVEKVRLEEQFTILTQATREMLVIL